MTDQAKQLIEREKQEQTGYLDLGRCSLTEMPDLSGLEWLDTLILANEWWEGVGQQDKIKSSNRGPRNLFRKAPKSSFFPNRLRTIIMCGDEGSPSWPVKSTTFSKRLTQLHTLNLANTHLADLTVFEKLTEFQNPASKQTTEWFFLKNLPRLQSLDLSFNEISNPELFTTLPELRALKLRASKISNWAFLEKLWFLQSLDLSYNTIPNLSFLRNLPHLKILKLSGNQNFEVAYIQKCTQLQHLSLIFTKISDWSFLANLTQLLSLDLSHNEITNLPYLTNLTQLQYLNLSANQITDLKFLKNITQLRYLRLSLNQVQNLTPIQNLTKLQHLSLSLNQITDISSLERLKQLKTLNLRGNHINTVTPLQNLVQLRDIDLSGNRIVDITFFQYLIQLRKLDLSNNQIADVASLQSLKQLRHLDLSHNRVENIASLLMLPNLEKVALTDNRISKLPRLSQLANHQLLLVWKNASETKTGELNLKGNPFSQPPVEVIKKGNAYVLEYFQQQRSTGTRPLLEAKLILLGDARAGKTSLANRLLGKELPKEEDRTQGVDIIIGEYHFPIEGRKFKLNIWDFAGQDKYKSLHQFFYTEDAVYVLVADSGTSTDYDDWLQTAELFGKGSPLVIALNEFRKGIGKGLFDEEYWFKQFPKILKEVQLVNLLTLTGFPALERCICYLAEQLPHARVEYPNNWADIRAILEDRRDQNFITLQEYLRICTINNLPERKGALVLSEILHKVGVCLHYQDNEILRRHVILNNEWATQAVYEILEDDIITNDQKGFFDWSDLRRIWTDKAYIDMRPELLALMQEFKLAYPLPSGREFVTPSLLPAAPPTGWNLPPSSVRIELYIEYKFIPKALMTQFIVSCHADIDKGRTLVWRNGVVLRWSTDTVAEVRAFKSRGRNALCIVSQGIDRRALLTAILRTLRRLHKEYQGIEAYETLPCPCEHCAAQDNARDKHFFDFSNLQNRLEKGRTIVECDKSLEEISLVELLGGFLVFDQLRTGKPLILKDTHNPNQPTPPLAFFSYSKKDVAHLDTLRTQLRPMERNRQIRLWDDRQIRPGEEWDDNIRTALQSADIIFLLLSSDFLATDYIDETEIAIALERHRKGEARVIPIQLRPCHWQDTALGELQAIPRKDNIISTAANQDEIWLDVLTEIKDELEHFRKQQ